MRVLVADDERMTRTLLERTLTRWGHSVLTASNGTEAWAQLTAFEPPGLAILNWSMPGIDGPELCRRVRALAQEPYVYLLLLTSRSEKEDVIAGLEAGADDFLTLPLDMAELSARVRGGVRVIDLQSQLISAREALRAQALRDPLTGLYNRRAVMESLDRELSRARRVKGPLSLLVLDIDHFKKVNDTLGHYTGDIVLKEVARRCLAAIRPYDTIGRIGGEEFLVVLPGVPLDLTRMLGDRIRASLSATPIGLPDGRLVHTTVSIGAAGGRADEIGGPDDIFQAADNALYSAKNGGRDRVEVAPPFLIAG